MLRREDVTHRLLQPEIFRCFVVEPDGVEIVGVFQIAHGGEGDVADAIDVVIAGLHFGRQHADHFKADAINANPFVQRVAAGKEFLFGFGTQHHHVGALHLVFEIVEASLVNGKSADGKRVGVFAADEESVSTGVVLNVGLFPGFWRDVADLWEVCGQRIQILHR